MLTTDINKMPKISTVLKMMDWNKVVPNYTSKYAHQVQYNNTRTIIKYIVKDVPVLAYACNPGNGIIIFAKKNGMIAYGGYFEGFPKGEEYSNYRWKKIEVTKALLLIKENFWMETGYDPQLTYQDSSYSAGWLVLETGKIEYVTGCSGAKANLTIDQYKGQKDRYINDTEFSLKRLKTGKLRVEMDSGYYPYSKLLDIITFFQEHKNTDQFQLHQFPNMNSWRKVISITAIEDDLLEELKVQVIAEKMKKAA